MAEPVTIQDIYDLFRVSQQESERRAAEADLRAVEADRRTAELDRQLAQLAAEADRRSIEADRRLTRIEQLAAQASQEVSRLGSRWGQFVENLVEPAVVQLFQARGIEVQETYRRLKSKRPAAPMEIDIFAVNGAVAVAIEVKSRLSRRDVDDFLEKLQRFKQSFIHFQDYRLYGAVAAIEIDENIDRYAYQRGLFVIRQQGDAVEIVNNATFQPAAW